MRIGLKGNYSMTTQKNKNLSFSTSPSQFGLSSSKKRLISQTKFVRKGEMLSKKSGFMEKKKSPAVFFNVCFDKNHLKTLIAWFLDTYGEKRTVDLVENLKKVGFHQATRAGVSLGLDDLKIPPQKAALLYQAARKMSTVSTVKMTGTVTTVEKSQQLIDTWNQTSETLRETAIHHFRTTNPVNPVYMMAFSGARGNISQVRQLVAMRGLMADPQGAIVEFPIQSNFREGLTVTEYLISCYGARKGLVDTALRTATSGYLTRRLVDAVQHVVIRISDCQTTQGIIIKEKNLEQRLIGRVLLQDLELTSNLMVKKNTLISQRLAKKIASKYTKVFVRSPLTCQTEKSVCQLCYGLDLGENKLVNIGEPVGIIAAQSIGEPGTQLTMRTFHTGGVGVFSEQSTKSFNSPFVGKVEFPEPLPGFFVRTPHGKIVYLLKHETSDEKKPILRLCSTELSSQVRWYEIYSDNVPAGSLLWVKQGEKVKNGQLLIQALNLETKKQTMPESSHPVLSPYSGEVFFEFMRIRETEVKKKSSSKKDEMKVPIIPTLRNLGNFWIMSSFIQKETYQTKKFRFCDIYASYAYGKTKGPLSFFQKGDLVSTQTPIHQINIHLESKGQLKIVNSSLIFCFFAMNIQFLKIKYSQGSYFFRPLKKLTDVIVSTPKSDQIVLTWYPLFLSQKPSFIPKTSLSQNDSFLPKREFGPKNKIFGDGQEREMDQVHFYNQQLGYCFRLPCFELPNENFEANPYVWAPHSLFHFNESTQKFSLVQFSKNLQPSFLVSDDLFSHSGCFQMERRQHKRSDSQLSENFVIKTRFFVSSYPKNEIFGIRTLKEKEFVKNPLQKNDKAVKKSNFTNTKLQSVQQRLFTCFRTQLIQKENIWFYVPEISVSKSFQYSRYGLILEPGKNFENVSFPNSYTCLQRLQTNTILLFEKKGLNSVKNSAGNYQSFYDINHFLNKNEKFIKVVSSQKSTQKQLFKKISRTLTNDFCFYKQSPEKEWIFSLQQKQLKGVIFAFQRSNYRILPKTKLLKEKWLEITNRMKPFSIKSPLFTKQQKTRDKGLISRISGFRYKQKIKFNVKFLSSSTWCLPSEFLKVEIRMQPYHSPKISFLGPNTGSFQEPGFGRGNAPFNKIEQIHQIVTLKTSRNASEISNHLMIPEWNSFFYTKQMFQDPTEFCFQTFENSWVLPEFSITQAFLKSKTLGEFRGFQNKIKQTLIGTQQREISLSLGRTRDFVTYRIPVNAKFNGVKSLSSEEFVSTHPKNTVFGTTNSVNKKKKTINRVGLYKRLGQEWSSDFTCPTSGQIVKITQDTLTLRKGIPLLASLRGLVHVLNADFVQKNQLLVTLKSKRLQTEDIVQGIPKIEQLFEARETKGGEIIQNNMHMLLHNFFRRASRVRANPEAVALSLRYIQFFLVDNILQAYSNQGVSIAEKHVEVVVRQMTARVRIVEGGDTGLLPGELIQHRLITKLNKALEQEDGRPARYEPVILGITKSVLQSESFLLAASFQQVSKVLVQSALAKKTDFLRGLHENLLVGQLIPAGTGTINISKYSEKRKKRRKALTTKQLDSNS